MATLDLPPRGAYVRGSLHNGPDGIAFRIANGASPALLTGVRALRIDDSAVPLDAIGLDCGSAGRRAAADLSEDRPVALGPEEALCVCVSREPLPDGEHRITLEVESRLGGLSVQGTDGVWSGEVPRDDADDYAPEVVAARQRWVQNVTGRTLRHLVQCSFDPHRAVGNCERFTGVAQVPLGIAGPLRVNGEHARGDFLVPLATSEGTLVASYNRGMAVLNRCGGVRSTVSGDAMQRAPVFMFADARQARDFTAWLDQHFEEIRAQAEATDPHCRLIGIERYLASRFAYLRFNCRTGDAAGQNTASRATLAACDWIAANHPAAPSFYLEANLATDKKASHLNTLNGRGKRVTAEAVIRREVLMERMRVEPERLVHHYGVANLGALLSGANNNGLHSANAITAMFIATGQDVANVAESSAGLLYAELTPERDLYLSITLPSLIVATHGGGTGLPTQRECLELMDCHGAGKVMKLAEIMGAVVLAGELSLAAAISAVEWVSAHERMGRHR